MHLLLAAALLALTGPEDAFKLKLIPEGASSKIGFYAPVRAQLKDARPDSVKKVPDGLAAPMYGVLKMTGPDAAVYHIVLDEPDGKPARLFIDANGNGDLTDDPAPKWDGKAAGKDGERELTQYAGSAKVNLGTASEPYVVGISMYRFDKTDPKRAGLKDILMYYRDYAVEGEIALGGKTYAVMLNDNAATGDFRGAAIAADADEKASSGVTMMIDVNGNGKFDRRGEAFDVRKPFNIAGTTYELADIARDGSTVRVVKSDKVVAEVALAPDHSVGKKITAFTATTTDGKTVNFPGDYKGKIVMIDFWATWCGPCMAEVPGLVKVYNAYHDKGFEILGISLDNDKTVEKLKPVTEEKGMTWTQVCDGLGWKAAIAQKYVVEGIPACWLVDGNTGEIIATEGQLRGARLEKTIEQALLKLNDKN
jgi:thiol-disulfide isomerase/thioredoxin